MSLIYFDNAATRRVRDEVFEEMRPFLAEAYGNPSSVYGIARENKKALDLARSRLAGAIGAGPEEIFFTGSGTEADNWAIIAWAEKNADKGSHIITSAIEHHAVLHSCEYLEKRGFSVTYLPVDAGGLVSPADLEKALTNETILVSVMAANNEIGTVQPVAELGAIARARGAAFHTDAVQALGQIPVDVKAMNVDMMSLSAHKVHGPKGVGALYVRKGLRLPPFIHGGGQERGKRAGTENVAGIAGFGKAAELAVSELPREASRLAALRERLINGILRNIPDCRVNGHREKRLPGNANISFDYIEGEAMLLMLDMKGICASSGSACTSGSLDPSHVLLALGLPHEKAHGSLRFSLGRYNTEEEVDAVIAALGPIVERLRAMSPLAKK